ncbi:MAG: imidazoleglycerol-phosphate dehydratase HisB [Solirubrobacteraceae bacterium]|nr:imidazoleglycerol-phosphate dehydratase HisB [Solirubrobacteraceae bacterium]
MARKASVTRTTGETDITLSVDLDGSGAGSRTTGVGFFDHMLDLLARHGLLDLDVVTKGDTQTGSHHTVEDTGIVLGQAVAEALGDRSGITRYGHAMIPMDEALARCAIDLSGRPFAVVTTPQLVPGVTGGFEHELLEEFVRAFAFGARATIHVESLAGTNAHHIIEAGFKALARALRMAVAIDPREHGIPSTKGSL